MSDFFLLEVYTHDLKFDLVIGDQVLQQRHASYAIAYQFLDYPLLLTYANGGGGFGSQSVIQFHAGKSCVLQEETEEIEFVLQKACPELS